MHFIAIDLENNQPSGKIIQIGAVAFDTQSGKTNSFIRYVDPQEPINWDCVLRGDNGTLGDLLPFGQDTMDTHAISPEEAFTALWEWVKKIGAGYKFVQWGRHDMHEITTQSKAAGVDYPNKIKTFNLKQTYQFLYRPAMKQKQGGGLGSALAASGLDFEGTPHDAYYDALNTGFLMLKMFKAYEDLKDIRGILK